MMITIDQSQLATTTTTLRPIAHILRMNANLDVEMCREGVSRPVLNNVWLHIAHSPTYRLWLQLVQSYGIL